MAETTASLSSVEQIKSTLGVDLNASERDALVDFKTFLIGFIPQNTSDTRAPTFEADQAPYDMSFISMLDSHVYKTDTHNSDAVTKKIEEEYEKLPATLQGRLETYQSLFALTGSVQEEQMRAVATIQAVKAYSGGSPSSDTHLDEAGNATVDTLTANAIRRRLEEFQKFTGEDELDPREFDQKAMRTLKKSLVSQAEKLGIQKEDMNIFLVRLWGLQQNGLDIPGGMTAQTNSALERFGETGALLNFIKLAANGETPNGLSVSTKPQIDRNWDPQWTEEQSKDLFFNQGVYRDLHNDFTVTTDVMFHKATNMENDPYETYRYGLLDRAAKNLDIDRSAGRVMSQMEVGLIANEILKLRAEDMWCHHYPDKPFDPSQTLEMYMTGKATYDLSDMLLARKGQGIPDKDFFVRDADRMMENTDNMQPAINLFASRYSRLFYEEAVEGLPDTSHLSKEEERKLIEETAMEYAKTVAPKYFDPATRGDISTILADRMRDRAKELGAENLWELEGQFKSAFIGHQNYKMTSQFGTIPQDDLDTLAQRLNQDIFSNPGRFVERNKQAPDLYFSPPMGTQHYKDLRNEYLKDFQKFLESGGGCLVPEPSDKPEDGMACAINADENACAAPEQKPEDNDVACAINADENACAAPEQKPEDNGVACAINADENACAAPEQKPEDNGVACAVNDDGQCKTSFGDASQDHGSDTNAAFDTNAQDISGEVPNGLGTYIPGAPSETQRLGAGR